MPLCVWDPIHASSSTSSTLVRLVYRRKFKAVAISTGSLTMDAFSWTDSFHATVSTCLTCFNCRGAGSDSEAENDIQTPARRGSQTRYEELEGLLGDFNDTDGNTETMSLHSNLGDTRRRRKKKKKRQNRSVRLFGYNLFGRPPIQLSDSEDDEAAISSRRYTPGRLAIGQLGSAHSSSSAEPFDSDASPLDPAVISQLSPQDAAARAARAAAEREAEEERRRQEQVKRGERRRRRKQRRELKRAVAAIANGATVSLDGEEFEGFPGSGSLRPPFSPNSQSSTASRSQRGTPAQDYGPFTGGTIPSTYDADDLADEEADFGGEVYVRKATSRSSDSSRSLTHSQTSASRSNADSSQYLPQHYQNHPHLMQTSSPNVPAFPPETGSPFVHQDQSLNLGSGSTPGPDISRKKKNSKRSSNSATTSSSKRSAGSPTSQSASLPSLESPKDSNFPQKFIPAEPFIVEHNEAPRIAPIENVPEDTKDSKFPTVGFGGVQRTSSTGSGVFLARRGDD